MADKKQILLVVRWPVGGIRTFLRYVYKGFDPAKWQFTLVAPDFDEVKLLKKDFEFNFVPVKNMPLDGSSGVVKLFKVVALELIKNKYNLVHSHGFTSAIASFLPTVTKKVPHILTAHETLNNRQFEGFKGAMRKIVMERVLSFLNVIHSVSHDAQTNLLEHFPKLANTKSKCVVIPNGIEVERFLNAEPRDLREELDLSKDVYLIGFFGRFMAPKGFRYLVDAIELLSKRDDLPKKTLVLTFGSGGFADREKREINSKGIESYFRHMPFTDNVGGSIKGLDVVVMPSISEACPLLPMETLVCGVPLIATNCIGLRECINNTPARIVPAKNASAIAEHIVNAMEHNPLDIFQAHIALARDRFNVKNQITHIESLYSRMVIHGNE